MKRFGLVLLLLVGVLTTQAAAREGSDESESVVFLGDNGVIVLKFEIRLGETGPRETTTYETGPRTAFEQSVERLMQALDKDGNGIVKVEEAQGRYLTSRDLQPARVPVPAGNRPLVAEPTPDVTPADGKITRQEFLAYFKRIGLFPFQMLYQSNVATAAMNRPGRPADGSPSVPLFERLDTNGDGKLSSSELTDALKTLHKLDLDDDETISLAELNPLGNGAGLNAMPANGARNPAKSPFLGVGSDESISKQIGRLIDKYDSVDPLKSGVEGATVRNQKLSRQELGLSVVCNSTLYATLRLLRCRSTCCSNNSSWRRIPMPMAIWKSPRRNAFFCWGSHLKAWIETRTTKSFWTSCSSISRFGLIALAAASC